MLLNSLPCTGQLAPVNNYPAPNVNGAEPEKTWNVPELPFLYS